MYRARFWKQFSFKAVISRNTCVAPYAFSLRTLAKSNRICQKPILSFSQRIAVAWCILPALSTTVTQNLPAIKGSCTRPLATLTMAGDTTQMKLLSQEEAVQVDVELMKVPGFSIDQLMELAGLSCASAIADAFPDTSKPILVLVGPGNNGGDGLVAARHLKHFGYTVDVCYPKQNNRPLFDNLVQQCQDAGVQVVLGDFDLDEILAASDYQCVVDGMLGFSFKPPMRPPFADIIAQLVQSGTPPIVSIDIPSGWDVNKGPNAEVDDNLEPAVLISLTAPKTAAQFFRGERHYIGGRFVPPDLSLRYGIEAYSAMYKGSNQFALLETPVACSLKKGPANTVAMTDETEVVVVWVTAPAAEAHTLADRLVSEGLAACVNRIPGVQSTYMWEGKVNTDEETLMMVKSTVAGLPRLTQWVADNHSYDVPETIAAAIVGGNAAYLAWVKENVKPQ